MASKTEPATPSQGDELRLAIVRSRMRSEAPTVENRRGPDGYIYSGDLLNHIFASDKHYKEVEAAIQAQIEASYKQGFSDGQDSFLDHGLTNLGDSDPANHLYTQAQLDEAVREAREDERFKASWSQAVVKVGETKSFHGVVDVINNNDVAIEVAMRLAKPRTTI